MAWILNWRPRRSVVILGTVALLAFFERHAPSRHTLHVLPGYSHLDVFMGHRAAQDVFPLIAAELEKPD